MSDNGTPILDTRDAVQVLGELLARRPAYVPEWLPAEHGAARALLQIFARHMQVVIDRFNQAPEKNLLAFLDMLGISLIPAQAARAPVVFQAIANIGDSRVPVRTRVGAQVPGRSDPIVFETENAIAMAAGRLVEVVTLWSARDEYADHSTSMAGGRPFTLFESLQPVPHELYLAHNTLFAFAGDATVGIEFELAAPGSAPLKTAWEYWDGQVWRPFKPFDPTDSTASQDGTAGLTRSGVVTLHAECGDSQKSTINGIDAYWVRGRLDQPLPPDPARALPMLDRVRLRCAIERPAYSWEVQQQEVSGQTRIEGVVRDGMGAPIVGATVARSPEAGAGPTVVMATNEQGQFGFLVSGNEAYKISVLLAGFPTFQKTIQIDTSAVKLDLTLTPVSGSELDQAFTDSLQLDVSKTFYPLGQQPQLGSTFYFSSQEVFSKPDARMTVWLKFVRRDPPTGAQPLDTPEVAWEYWNGHRWAVLGVETDNADVPRLTDNSHGTFTMVVPTDMKLVEVNKKERFWMRARLIGGAYGFKREISYMGPDPDNPGEQKAFPLTIFETVPPALADMRLGYSYRSPWERPEHCLTYSDFQYQNHSRDVRWPGGLFTAFRPVADTMPALYLGFDRPLPNDLISLYLDMQESEAATPPLVWEAWDGTAWHELFVTDETAELRRPGMVSFITPDVAPRPQAAVRQASGNQIIVSSAQEAAVFQPGDQVVIRQNNNGAGELASVQRIEDEVIFLETPLTDTYAGSTVSEAAFPRFGTPRDWIRARLKVDGAPAKSNVNGIYLNAAWAEQVQTIDNEVLGSGTDQPNQTLFFRQTPVLRGEQIEVRELEGGRADVELPILREELLKCGLTEEYIRPVLDPRTGRVKEVWVRWQSRPHLFFSSPDDRHYTVERARGRLIFGDGRNGRLPSVGANNIRAPRYQAGGGLAGNVPAGAITQLLSGVLAQGVTNPRAAEGGADGESPTAVKTRGPQTLRHRGRSVAARDYEALAREASPGVAAARALPATAPNGLPAPGWVTVIIVPQSQERQPWPSYGLRRQVHDYLAARAPATVATGRIAVIGPTYLPIGVAARIAPRDVSEAGVVERRVQAVLESFLHPLTGGPEDSGWPFGRDVYLSDVAAVVEPVVGVDYVKELDLLLNDTPQGEWIAVPPDRIVVAGPIRIEMKAAER